MRDTILTSARTAILLPSLLISFILLGNQAYAQTLDVNGILSTTKAAANKDRNENAARERRFSQERSKQQGRLAGMRNERARQERISDQLDAQFKANEILIEQLRDELRKEIGDLQELFGVIQQTASEAQEDYKTSLISAQYPDRAENLRLMVAKMASQTQLVSIDEIEDLWFQLQNELNEQGKVVKYVAPVRYLAGQQENENGEMVNAYASEDRHITRVGVFTAVSDNDIVTYNNEQGLSLLDRQMDSSFTNPAKNLQQSTSGVTSFLLDPTKGSLLAALVTKPSITEKVDEGKAVGYVIIALGLIALVIAVWRILVLSGVEAKVRRQARDIKRPSLRNPLGRVLKVYQDNPDTDPESMELKLAEAILKESPKLNAWVMFVKIIAVVAPLLGLLGTVTGMIQTFQAITLFGAGDPQMMAGGISQALVTTVLGLVVAIPTVFLHWMASSRAKRVEDMLEEHAAGLIAEQYRRHA